MGCRPSKQATSKVRAVEHKDDFRCSCSPRKVRKHHKCASGSNISRRVSAGSGRGSSKQSLSSSHKPRSSRSADVDFPAFSTTTAVYRTSASKTSKITLRLSCDGSTLEIEQCDYDLEKVRGENETKPRPWNSAPNLTKMRDGKSRLFLESYLPMKHSKSGWSPSFLSPTSRHAGAFFRAPVQVNTPDDSLCSSGNISGYSFSVFSQGSSHHRDKNSMYQPFESSTFAGKTFGKTALNKSNTSSKCSSGDERRPLLLDILKESHKKVSLEGNINKAASAASMENTYKGRTQTCSSLDNMINELETSLAMVHRVSCSSVPQAGRPYSLASCHVASADIHRPAGSCCPDYLPETAMTFTAWPSPDIEHIPVNVISSFITCQGQPVTCVECNRNFCPLDPSPDLDCSADHRQDAAVISDPSSAAASAGKPCRNTHPQCLTNCNHGNAKQSHSNDIFKKDNSTHKYSDPRSIPNNTSQHATGGISDVSHISLQLARSIDSNSIVPLDTQDCSAVNNNPGLFVSTSHKPSASLVTAEHNVSCLSDRRHMFELDPSRPGLDRPNQTVQECAVDCREDDVYRSKDTRLQFQVQNTLNNIHQGDGGKAEGTSRNQNELSGMTFRTHIPRSATFKILPGAQNYCSDVRRAQMTGIEFCENAPGTRHGENFPSSLEVMDGAVREKYIILHENKQRGDERPSGNDRTTFSHFPHSLAPDYWHCMQQKSAQEEKSRKENLELHRVNNSQIAEGEVRPQIQVCSECMNGIPSESISRNLNLIKKSSQSECFPHRLHENTRLWRGSIDSRREDVHQLGLVQANESSSLANSNLECGRPSPNETRHLNTTDRHDPDRFSEDAGYLIGLLFPERANFITPLNSNTRFSFDFEYLDESEVTGSSNSDSSDNEISPLCYSWLGQQAGGENYRLNLNSQRRDTQDVNIQPAITSMQNVREIIVYQRLAKMDPCVTSMEDRCADLQMRLDLPSERNSFNSGVYSENSSSCFRGFPEHVYTSEISLGESRPLLAKIENPITKSLNIIHGNALDNRQGNDLGNKQEIMILGGDITVPNYSARISVDSPKRGDTDTQVCENLSFAKLTCPDSDANSFCSLLAFSETSERTRKRLLGFSKASDVTTTDQPTQVDSTSGQVLIRELTSGCWHPRKNPGQRRTEQIINTGDRHPDDATLAPVVNSGCQAITDNEWALHELLYNKHTTSNEESDRGNSRDNEACCSVYGGITTPESLSCRSSHELDSINSSIRAHLRDVGMGKNHPHTVNEKTAILSNGMQVLLSSYQRRIDRLNNNNSSVDDEPAASLSSLNPTTANAVNAFPDRILSGSDADHPGTAVRIDSDIVASENNQVRCSEITACQHETILTEPAISCCHKRQHETASPDCAKQMVSCNEAAATQLIPNIRSETAVCQPMVINSEVQSNCPSENISCNLAVVSSTKTINGKQNFHTQYHLLDQLYQDTSIGNNAKLEPRSSAERENVYLGSLLTNDSSKLLGNSSKLACLATDVGQEGGFIQGSNPTKCPIILGSSDGVNKGMLDNVGQEQIEDSLHMPRNNVLSLVRYFEKVPYTRRETKQ